MKKKNVEEEQLKILEIALDCINNNKDISILKNDFDKKQLNQSGLLSLKPKIFVCNVDEQSVKEGNNYTKAFVDKFGQENTLIVSADIENLLHWMMNLGWEISSTMEHLRINYNSSELQKLYY